MIDVLTTAERVPESLEATWRLAIKRRIFFVLVALALWGTCIQARLLWLQVVEHDRYTKKALKQQESTIKLPGTRGDILDRHGRELAQSADGVAIVAAPKVITDPDGTAAAVCRALANCSAKDQADLTAKLSDGKDFAWVRRWRDLKADQIDRVRELDLPGIELRLEPGRYYPNGSLLAHVLGFVGVDVDVDNAGLAGIERTYNDEISGQPGKMLAEVDGHRRALDTYIMVPPTVGATIELTIDRDFQYIAERELEAGVKQNKANGGVVIIMDPNSGEILAMASYPSFNPNFYTLFSADERRNRATQDVYEPGSTFKMVTASAAIEEGVLKPTDIIDTDPGYITFPGRKPITEASHHNYGSLTFEDVIVKSSNIGAIKAGLKIGAERLGRYVHRLGFGERLGHDFEGQSQGIVWPATNMSDSTLASMAMGYNVSVTPLQMVTAASAIANGGTLYEPHVVAAIIRKGTREEIEPKVVRKSVSQETAATVTTFMEGVVQRGTAQAAQLDQYQAAGKTGTAHKLENGHYADNDYNASFVGFVPSRHPVYTILVLIDTPRAGPTVGGLVAAPIFKRIAEAVLQKAAVPPTLHPTPALLVNVEAPPPAAPPVLLSAAATTVAPGMMPDVRGLCARDAMRALTAAGLRVQLRGSGVVVSQAPEPGRSFDAGEVSVLDLRRELDPVRPPNGSQR